MPRSNHMQMRFVCDQDWSTMQHLENGRFCEQCQKCVHDFTTPKGKELLLKAGNDPDLCGLFDPLDLEPDLIRPIEAPAARRALAYLTTAILALGFNAARAQVPAKPVIEQHDDLSAPDEAPSERDEICPVPKNQRATEATTNSRTRYRHPKRVYLSRRFPFIVRRRRVMGYMYHPPRPSQRHERTADRAKF